MQKLIYAGIGSRETPSNIIDMMYYIADYLSPNWTLRSGYADGADMAFASEVMLRKGNFEMYIPWSGFNGAPRNDPRFIVPDFTPELMALAEKFHPAWNKCSYGAKKLHARNGCQILGRDLKTPVNMVVCWTPGGKGGGGTGQAIRIAKSLDIPIFDLAIENKINELKRFIDGK